MPALRCSARQGWAGRSPGLHSSGAGLSPFSGSPPEPPATAHSISSVPAMRRILIPAAPSACRAYPRPKRLPCRALRNRTWDKPGARGLNH